MPHRSLPANLDLEAALALAWPLSTWSETRQLVAVSGGADSVALLRAMARLAPDRRLIDAAHFNHGWRGTESDADEHFVQALCTELGVRLVTGRAPQVAEQGRTEEAARQARYAFLIRSAYQTGARYVLTAHTADDRVETLLHNLFRGTGLAGVAAPTLTRPLDGELVLVRPLIGCTRGQIVDYLAQLGQGYRLDSSNADLAFRRNYIRRELLPLLRQQYGPQVDAKLLSFSELAEEAVGVLRAAADVYLREIEVQAHELGAWGDGQGASPCFRFPTSRLKPAPWPIVREALQVIWLGNGWPLQSMSRTQWEQIRAAYTSADVPSPAKPLNLPGGLQLQHQQDWLIIVPPQP